MAFEPYACPGFGLEEVAGDGHLVFLAIVRVRWIEGGPRLKRERGEDEDEDDDDRQGATAEMRGIL